MSRQPFRRRLFHYRRWLSLEVTVIIIGIAIIFATLQIARSNAIPFVKDQQDYIIAAEAAIVGILLIEIIGRIIINRFAERGSKLYGVYLRTVIRIIGYLVVAVAIISILASNPALAISIGAFTGVVIGFASQNITANVLAAGLLVAVRTVRIGDTITVSGYTGQIADISLIYTVVDTDAGRVFVPNSMMITAAVLRRKPPDVPAPGP